MRDPPQDGQAMLPELLERNGLSNATTTCLHRPADGLHPDGLGGRLGARDGPEVGSMIIGAGAETS